MLIKTEKSITCCFRPKCFLYVKTLMFIISSMYFRYFLLLILVNDMALHLNRRDSPFTRESFVPRLVEIR